MKLRFPKKFTDNAKACNSQGHEWLANLEALITHFAQKWELTQIKIFNNLSVNFVSVAYSERYKSKVILKISMPNPEFINEQKALLYYNGIGCVKLLDYDLDNYGLLLEYITPGNSLKPFFPDKEEESIIIAAEVIKKLHGKKIDHEVSNFPKLADWLDLFNYFADRRISQLHIVKAKEISADLIKSQTDLYLLHGDLHHENILKQTNSWIAIDPKGVVGEFAYEMGAFIRNPFELLVKQKNVKEIIQNRYTLFSELLNIEQEKIANWTYVQAVLAACWSIQDKSKSYQELIKLVDLIAEIGI